MNIALPIRLIVPDPGDSDFLTVEDGVGRTVLVADYGDTNIQFLTKHALPAINAAQRVAQ